MKVRFFFSAMADGETLAVKYRAQVTCVIFGVYFPQTTKAVALQPAFELFSDILAYRDNALTRVDPRVKFMLAVLAILGVLLSTGFAFPPAIFAACLAAMMAVRMPLRLILVRLAAPLGIVLVVIVLQSAAHWFHPAFQDLPVRIQHRSDARRRSARGFDWNPRSGSSQRTSAFELHHEGAPDIPCPALVGCSKGMGGDSDAHVPLYFHAPGSGFRRYGRPTGPARVFELQAFFILCGCIGGNSNRNCNGAGNLELMRPWSFEDTKVTCLSALCRAFPREISGFCG